MTTYKFPEVKTFPTRDLNQLYPYIKYLAEKLIEEAKKIGITINVTQTYRSTTYQNSLYAEGRTTKGVVVTNCKGGTSPHEFHIAFDICIIENGKAVWSNPDKYNKVGAIGRSLGLIWGGDWDSDGRSDDQDFTDRPHYQFNGGLTDKQIREGHVPTFPAIPIVKPISVTPNKPVIKPTTPTPPPVKTVSGGGNSKSNKEA
jgi:peptidoglycan LD-endopeptidase CwlK